MNFEDLNLAPAILKAVHEGCVENCSLQKVNQVMTRNIICEPATPGVSMDFGLRKSFMVHLLCWLGRVAAPRLQARALPIVNSPAAPARSLPEQRLQDNVPCLREEIKGRAPENKR